jgi:hypothetical protein
MAIWRHSICDYPIDNPGELDTCPHGVIPECEDPYAGFEAIRLNVWECKSCHWLVVKSEEPLKCPSIDAEPCSDPDGGTFSKICD